MRETRLKSKDGREVRTLMSTNLVESYEGEMLGLLGMYVDNTGRKQLERQHRQAQKLEEIGLLAGGMAHNPS